MTAAATSGASPGASAVTRGEHPSAKSGVWWGAAAYTVWGLVTVFWKQLIEFNAFELIGYRILSSALLMGAVITVMGRLRPLLTSLRNTRLLGQVVVASLLLTANWTTYVWAVVHGQVIATALGYFMTPIGLMLAGVIVLHEPLRRAQRFALVLAIAAVVILTIAYGAVPWAALIIAVTWTSYTFAKKKSPLTAIESLTAETLVLFVPAVIVVVITAIRPGGAPDTASATQWTFIALTGLVTAAPLLMFAVAAQRLPLTTMALVQYIVPTINFFLAWLVYDENLNAIRVTGFVLVWIGLAAVTLDSLRRARWRAPA